MNNDPLNDEIYGKTAHFEIVDKHRLNGFHRLQTLLAVSKRYRALG
jgi:hypothetical protein